MVLDCLERAVTTRERTAQQGVWISVETILTLASREGTWGIDHLFSLLCYLALISFWYLLLAYYSVHRSQFLGHRAGCSVGGWVSLAYKIQAEE